ncbi:MAG: hypothetical protein ABJN62_05575 [Halioglobus sp.]
MKQAFYFVLGILALSILAGCQTSDSTLRDQGHSGSYVQGFHDGRHSGMKEAGNDWEHYLRDQERFESDNEYREGWLAGEAEGKTLQQQAEAVGNSAAGAYSGYEINKEVNKAKPHPDKIAKDVMKDVDTGELKSLEK